MTYLRIAFYTVLTLIAVNSSVASAQNAGRWYQVEVLIFKRNNLTSNPIKSAIGANGQTEVWRNDISLQYPQKYRFINNPLSSSTHQLGGYSYILKRNENFEVLFHKAWNQQMWGEKRSIPLIIQAGQRHGDHRELEGSINIHIGRFLHFTTNLWLSEFIYGNNDLQNSSTYWPALPTLNNVSVDSNANTINNESSDADPFLTSQARPSRIVQFTERRSMRSKETHYIDHPEMGILVRMLPIDSKK
jgi:hypothetical protein